MEDNYGNSENVNNDTKEANQPNSGSVTLKPSAIEQKNTINPDGVGNKAVHLPPYHTKETAKIAEDRQKENEDKNKDKPYEYTANGYTVTEKDRKGAAEIAHNVPDVPNRGWEDGNDPTKEYEVTADGDFLKVFPTRRAAEIYVETHAEAHKDLPATISKA